MYVKRDGKTGIYKYRRKYPADVAAKLGKDTFIKSFGTTNRKAVDKLYSAVEAAYLAAIESNGSGNTIMTMPIAHKEVQNPQPATQRNCGMTLTEALHKWKVDHADAAHKTFSDWELAVKRFIELSGDLDIAAVTIEQVEEYCSLLARLPRNVPNQYHNSPVRELVALLERGVIVSPPVSSRTVQKMRNALNSIFENAIKKKRFAIINPVSAVTVKATSKKRVRFNDNDLHKIFGTEFYAKNPIKHLSNTPEKLKDDAYFLLPIIGLYTGARLGEIGQLHLSDVMYENGVHFFSINDWADDKDTKTEGSVRIVPIHNEILKFGLLDYIAFLKKYKHIRLFPALEKSKDGRYTKVFSQWFGRYLDNAGIRHEGLKERKDYHSFRHTFKTMMRIAKIETDNQDAILGHDTPGQGRDYGDFPPEVLNPEIQKVLYNLNLSHLHITTKFPLNPAPENNHANVATQEKLPEPVPFDALMKSVSLAESYNRTGRKYYGAQWVDYEICVGEKKYNLLSRLKTGHDGQKILPPLSVKKFIMSPYKAASEDDQDKHAIIEKFLRKGLIAADGLRCYYRAEGSDDYYMLDAKIQSKLTGSRETIPLSWKHIEDKAIGETKRVDLLVDVDSLMQFIEKYVHAQ